METVECSFYRGLFLDESTGLVENQFLIQLCIYSSEIIF